MKLVTSISISRHITTLLCVVLYANAGLVWAEESAGAANPENLPTAVVWYMEMAKSGDADAQYNLGSVYETGFGVKADPDEAVRWYKEAADQDHQLAQLKLGIMYVLGDGARQSIIKGTNWIRSSADNGNQFAKMLYEKVLSPDVVREMTAEEIIKKVRPFIDLGEKKSIEKLVAILEKDKQKAKEKEPELAERFTGKSKNTLGQEVEIANNVPEFVENKGKAVVNFADSNLALLQREANAGNAEAQYQLGRMYDTGDKLERDRQKAITWFTSAAKQGHADAQYRLAIAYLYGISVPKNISAGENWLTNAAKQNHPVAKEMIPIYLANRSVNMPTSIALNWYLEKAAKGDPDGQFGVGNMYENGWGLNVNNNEARKWFAAARAAGSGDADRHIRQLKAVAASQDPDPPPESRPKLPEKINPPTVTVEQSQDRTVAVTNTLPARKETVSNQAPRRVSQAGVEDSEASSAATLTATLTRRSPLTPIILIVFGVIMGLTVFKWMRRGAYKRSVF
ncbi:MAG: sel1 repeat family protein [Gammaproteobacteria bacterium]|nr:sel1 repeat family protein [Gammaproteobacteria bacterium]